MDLYDYIIYMYTFPNDKKYIGKTKRALAERQGSDWSRYKKCTLLWNAIQKYGTDNICTDILFSGQISDEESSELERYFIAKYKTNANRYNNPSYGYNLTDGGEGVQGWYPSPERLQVLQDQMRQLGKQHLGTKVSDETRRKLSNSHKGLRTGTHLSEETKRKIGLANSLANISEETRRRKSESSNQPVSALNSQTGDLLTFPSQHDAAEYFGVRDSAVSRWIKGTRNPTNGYVFSNYTPTTTE